MAAIGPESAASLGFSVLGGVMDFVGGFVQAGKQRQLTDEYVKRLELEQKKTLSAGAAQGAAAGVEFESSSLQKYLTDMAAEFRTQINWTRTQGYDTADSLMAAGAIKGFGDVGKGLFDFSKANNFWREPTK